MTLGTINRSHAFLVLATLITPCACGTERVIGETTGGNAGSVSSGGKGTGGASVDNSGGFYLGTTLPAGGRTASTGGVAAGGSATIGGTSNTAGQAGSAGSANDDVLAKACTDSGGTLSTSLCCTSLTGDFPNSCTLGACGCAPSSSKTVRVCLCGTNSCWNGQSCVAP